MIKRPPLTEEQQKLVDGFMMKYESPVLVMIEQHPKMFYLVKSFGYKEEEIEQHGYYGVVRAAGQYVKGDAVFETYANYWIWWSLKDLIDSNTYQHNGERKFKKKPCSYPEEFIPVDHRRSFIDVDDMIDAKTLLSMIEDKRDRRIIEHRFGLNGRKIMNTPALGRKFKISRARVQQIEVRTIKKLKQMVTS